MDVDYEDGLTLLSKGKTVYPGDPDEAGLEWFENRHPDREYVIRFDCPEFTSVCPITGQPDFAKIVLTYVPDLRCLESKSLKLYLGSFRNRGMFHEEITNRILDDVAAVIEPRWAKVRGIMNPRGGISIEVTAVHVKPGYDPDREIA